VSVYLTICTGWCTRHWQLWPRIHIWGPCRLVCWRTPLVTNYAEAVHRLVLQPSCSRLGRCWWQRKGSIICWKCTRQIMEKEESLLATACLHHVHHGSSRVGVWRIWTRLTNCIMWYSLDFKSDRYLLQRYSRTMRFVLQRAGWLLWGVWWDPDEMAWDEMRCDGWVD
jgi:hypothetical protein